MFENTRIEIGSKSEKLNEYKEFEFENGIKLIFRILDDKPSMRFIDKDGKDLVDLIELAPPGTIFQLDPDNKWSALVTHNEEEAHEIRLGEFNNVSEAILFFLHEAGHLDGSKSTIMASKTVQEYSNEISRDKDNVYPQKRLIAMARAKDAELKSERSAWAFALKKTRELEKRLGIKIFDKIGGSGGTAEKAKNFANSCWGTYEKSYIDELDDLHIYTKKDMEKFFEELLSEAK